MKNRVSVALLLALLAAGVAVCVLTSGSPDPNHFAHWLRVAQNKDWSSEPTRTNPETQFYLGLTLLRTNLLTRIDRVPLFSNVPLLGKRFFVNVTYNLDATLAPETFAEARQWIQKSADQGYPPALETQKLFPSLRGTQKTAPR